MDLTQLLNEMTLNEKIGQLVQLTPNFFEETNGDTEITGPLQEMGLTTEDLNLIGSVLGTHTKEQVISIQKNYLANSRLKIPLIFMADVVHGYETIFPVPLGLASSWNTELVKEVASLSGREASDAGIHVTFSPMVDLVRDPRWGRVMEGTGEDSYLNSLMAKAFVEGYQGEEAKLDSDFRKIAACVKHFIGYGASEAGRDYNTVDISTINLYQSYLPSFKAAIDSGVKLVMTSFNTIYGVPATGNKWLMRSVLRDKLGFDGVLISDWAAIGEMLAHGVARDLEQAAKLALEAGVDIDMMTPAYQKNLKYLVESQQISENLIDEAVLRVLQLKEDLGLFEDPYRGLLTREELSKTKLRLKTREIASQSMVLLKNEEQLLPLNPSKKISLVGPLANSHDVLGAWSWVGKIEQSVTLSEGLSSEFTNIEVIGTKDRTTFTFNERKEMLRAAKESEVVIVALGEGSEETGEAASKGVIKLPKEQLSLLKEIQAVNSQVVTILFNGRPLDLSEIVPYSQSILEAWFPGSEAGNSVSDVLLGRVNPSGKLPMSFPVTTGQIPVYYNHLRTGRPMSKENKNEKYISRFLDIPNEPLYPFGYGLSYTSFSISEATLSSKVLKENQTINVTAKITNTGDYTGTETVQCYLKAEVGEVARPVRELKAFKQVSIKPNETIEVTFIFNQKDLEYVHSDLSERADFGNYVVYVGSDSQAPEIGRFSFEK